MPSAEDLAAKQRFIEAFFEELRERVKLTQELFERDFGNEARLLCCSHIEGLGNWLNPDLPAGARTFVKVVADCGGDPGLLLVLPRRLAESLPWKSASPAVVAELQQTLGNLPQDQAYTESELIAALPSSTTPEALSFLQGEVWRGTVASIAYQHIRGLGAHWLGSSSGVSFSSTTHHGVALPTVDYQILKAALDRILSRARTISLSSGKWFGHT